MATYLANDFESAWREVLAPWFETNRTQFLRESAPAVVLVPTLSFAHAVRTRLARARAAFAGIHFWVPNDARRYLAGIFPDLEPASDRETLRLVLAAAAEEALSADPALLSARAVAAHPDGLLQSIDRLAAGGWSVDELGDDELVTIAQKFLARLDDLGLTRLQTRDFECARRLREGEFRGQPIASLLVAGFSGADWPVWPVLESAAHLAREVTVCLRPPRNDGLGLEAAWIGTWEAISGAAETIGSVEMFDRPMYRYAEAIWAAGGAEGKRCLTLATATGLAAQARAAVCHAIKFLKRRGCVRVGILMPEAGALSREIGAALEAAAIPFWNDLGTPKPGFFEQARWKSVLAFLDTPGADTLLAVLGTGARPADFPALTRNQVEGILRKGRTQSFLEEFGLLIRHLVQFGADDHAKLGAYLAALPLLPQTGTFSDFRSAFGKTLTVWGWGVVEVHLFAADAENDPLRGLQVSRENFLRWVRERACTATRVHGEFGGHPYARIVLTTYARGAGMPWSSVVLTGLNEGSFPPPYSDSVFLGEQTIFDLNEKVRRLNESSVAVIPGSGIAVAPGKALIVGPVEERWAAQQHFITALEETEKTGVALASVSDEISGKDLRPGEFFMRLFEADFGRPLETAEMRRAAAGFAGRNVTAEIVTEVRTAFDRRRDASIAIDEYLFSFRADAPRQILLGASGWEAAFSYPAQQWCRSALGITLGADDGELPWNLTVGEWAHGWLAAAANTGGAVVCDRKAGHFRASVDRAASAQLESVRAFFAVSNRSLPRWWLAAFEKARFLARRLANALDAIQIELWPAFVCEATLPKASSARVNGGRLFLHGRMDLVFFDRRGISMNQLLAAGAKCWLFDFKSGKNKPLSSQHLAHGEGVQLGLYALALAESGATEAGLTLLKPGGEATMQLTLGEVRSHQPLWERLRQQQDSGRFGQLEVLRNEFQVGTAFPLATLAISPEILHRKLALAYPEAS